MSVVRGRRKNRLIVAGIPAYNEEKTIAKVVLLSQKYVDRVIVCDDGSTDCTVDIAEKMGALVIKHERNLGYGAAIQSLFHEANMLNADVLLTLDGDGQHNPEDIPALLAPLDKGQADIVIGSRFVNGEKSEAPAYRRFGIKLITKMSNGNGTSKISDAQSGFRAYNRKAVQSLELLENGMGVSAESLRKANDKRSKLRIVETPIKIKYDGLDTSTRNPWRHGLNVITTILKLVVEERPLFYLGIPGTVLFLSGMTCGFYFYFNYIAGSFLSNYLFVALVLMLFGSLALVTAVNLFAIVRMSERQRQHERKTTNRSTT